MTKRGWQQVERTSQERTQFSLEHAPSLTTSQAAKILLSKRFEFLHIIKPYEKLNLNEESYKYD